MRISDWSSDVCSSDLIALRLIESRADAEPRLADIAAVTAQPQQHAASDLGAVIEAQARAPPGDVGPRIGDLARGGRRIERDTVQRAHQRRNTPRRGRGDLSAVEIHRRAEPVGIAACRGRVFMYV